MQHLKEGILLVKLVDMKSGQIQDHSWEGSQLLLKHDNHEYPKDVGVSSTASPEMIKLHNEAIEHNAKTIPLIPKPKRFSDIKTTAAPTESEINDQIQKGIQAGIQEALKQMKEQTPAPVQTAPAASPGLSMEDIQKMIDKAFLAGQNAATSGEAVAPLEKKVETEPVETESTESAISPDDQARLSELMKFGIKELRDYAGGINVDVKGMRSKEDISKAIIAGE